MDFDAIFNDLINNTPRELTPYVTNEQGYFLAHPNKEKTFSFEFEKEEKIQDIYKNIELRGSDVRDFEFTENALGNVMHVVRTYYDPAQPSKFLAVMLATSSYNLQSGADLLRQNSYIIIGFLVLISLFVSGILVFKLMRPLQLIVKASDELANGNKISELPITSADEIGELARSFDHMRHQIEEKEREIIMKQGQMHHANKMASLGEVAAGMAHEINSPIQAINMTAQRVQRQLKKNMPVDDIDSSMERIINSVSKVSKIIDSLRKVSRDSTNDNFIQVGVSTLIEDIERMTEERFKVNNIKFEVKYNNTSTDQQIQCQSMQISQVLMNLVNNAIDAIENVEDKWIIISIKKNEDKLFISVTDSGETIPESIVEKMFEPMFTSKDVGKGTGLGLSISKEIALKHNGLLYLDTKSTGTCFILELPVIHIDNDTT